MDGFTAEYLADLTATLTERVLGAAGRRVEESFAGSEEERALRRCIQAGTVALLTKASADVPEETALLEDIFADFFDDIFVAREISKLLRGRPPDEEELRYLFQQAGYDVETLPDLDFEAGMAAFEVAFIETALLEESALHDPIKAGNLLEHTALLRSLLVEVRTLVERFRAVEFGRVGIQAGTITAENVVHGVQVIHRWGEVSPTKRAVTSLEKSYLNHLFETVGHVSLAGIDRKAAGDTETRIDLHAVYTGLRTLTSEECERLRDKNCLPESGRETSRLSALAQLDRYGRLVLLGDPGSGKSTFVNFVALCLTGERLGRQEANLDRLTAPLPQMDDNEEPSPQPWSHGALLPVHVVLRDFAARGLPGPGEKGTAKQLCDFIGAELESAALGDYVAHLWLHLREKGGLLLLDGLDEVPAAEDRRIQLKQVVEDFAAAFPDCRILVTSRTYAYQQQAWQLSSFEEAFLAPFEEGQIRHFVDRWYAHMSQVQRLSKPNALGRAELLKHAIFASDRLQSFARRPLLLTLMASLHAWRGGSLPEKREELYADAVDLLLDWWESQRVVRNAKGEVLLILPSLAEWLKVEDRAKVRTLLNRLAYEAHAEQTELVGTADVSRETLVGGLLEIGHNPDVKPRRLEEYLSRRTGLLVPRGVGVYTFPHRTFQEYLAACHLTDHEYPDKVAELARADPNRWREVALLAGAKSARGSDFALWALVDALCLRDVVGELPVPDAWGALLAGQALVESGDLSQVSERNRAKLRRVRTHLALLLTQGRLPAVEQVAAGRVLAKLGDPRPGVGLRPDGLPDIAWCEVPAGPFLMGSSDEDGMAYDDEKPQHSYEIRQPYGVGRYPITNAQFAAFVEAGGYREERYWTRAAREEVWRGGKVKAWNEDEPREGSYDFGEPFNLPNHPVVGVTWYEAVAYCLWLTEQLREKGELGLDEEITLPSEAEWEKAARGTDGRIFPWGKDADPERANYGDTGIGTTSAVGCFPGGVGPYGVEDLSGNVWEWCRTKWEGDYEDYQGDDDLEGGSPRVVRGGAFSDSAWLVRCASRFGDSPFSRLRFYGFRVVVVPFSPTSEL
jgi:formylglycine-generating enzyme required for sulfatase activity